MRAVLKSVLKATTYITSFSSLINWNRKSTKNESSIATLKSMIDTVLLVNLANRLSGKKRCAYAKVFWPSHNPFWNVTSIVRWALPSGPQNSSEMIMSPSEIASSSGMMADGNKTSEQVAYETDRST